MIDHNGSPAFSSEDIEAKIQRQPHLYLRLIQNSLTVAESLRRNYFTNTTTFVRLLRSKMRLADGAFFYTADVTGLDWPNMRDEVVTFIDGGVGQVRIASQVPLLLRVGSYRVKVGERRLSEREQFGYYPIILGDLQGGSKDRKDFIDIVRITAELTRATPLSRVRTLTYFSVSTPPIRRLASDSNNSFLPRLRWTFIPR